MTRPNHFWTTAELRTLKELYPMFGPKGMLEHLPGRSYGSIISQANIHKLKFTGPRSQPEKRLYEPTEEVDERIRKLYSGPPVRGAIAALARELDYPDWWVKKRAAVLGVARVGKKDPPWSEAEEELLRENHWRDLDVIRGKFAAAGFSRSRMAISIRRKRLRLSPKPDDRYTATAIGQLLGVDVKTVTRWIEKDWLDAEKRGTERTERQGGDMWWVEQKELRRFIVNNPHLVDLRKIRDTEWFIHLVAGRAADGRQNVRKRPGLQEAA